MTVANTIDKREDYSPTFGQLNEGDAFTSIGCSTIFIKTDIIYDVQQNAYNTVSLDGDFYWSEDNKEIAPIRELDIIIKK